MQLFNTESTLLTNIRRLYEKHQKGTKLSKRIFSYIKIFLLLTVYKRNLQFLRVTTTFFAINKKYTPFWIMFNPLNKTADDTTVKADDTIERADDQIN